LRAFALSTTILLSACVCGLSLWVNVALTEGADLPVLESMFIHGLFPCFCRSRTCFFAFESLGSHGYMRRARSALPSVKCSFHWSCGLYLAHVETPVLIVCTFCLIQVCTHLDRSLTHSITVGSLAFISEKEWELHPKCSLLTPPTHQHAYFTPPTLCCATLSPICC
jgi:hypothetical protein